MKSRLSVLLAIMLFFVNVTARSDSAPEKEATDIPMSQRDMNDGYAKQFKLVDDKLNRLYKEKIDVIKTPTNKVRFRDAQRAWISFRDKVCLYEASTREETGSIWSLGYFYCMERHTRRRIEDLEEYIKCPPEECQN